MVTRTQIAHAFAEAKQRLSATYYNGPTFICVCLDSCRKRGVITQETCWAAIGIIEDRLGRSQTVASWLIANGWASEVDIHYDRAHNHGRNLQDTRHRWLDSLIKEFST